MKLTSLVFLSTLPLTLIAILAGAPALTALAYTVPVLLLTIAAHDYKRASTRYRRVMFVRVPARRRIRARLPLAA